MDGAWAGDGDDVLPAAGSETGGRSNRESGFAGVVAGFLAKLDSAALSTAADQEVCGRGNWPAPAEGAIPTVELTPFAILASAGFPCAGIAFVAGEPFGSTGRTSQSVESDLPRTGGDEVGAGPGLLSRLLAGSTTVALAPDLTLSRLPPTASVMKAPHDVQNRAFCGTSRPHSGQHSFASVMSSARAVNRRIGGTIKTGFLARV